VWPSTAGGETTVTVEFEKNCPFDLSDVNISIPIPGASPKIENATGSCEYDSKKNILHWRLPLIDKDGSSGNMEFSVPAAKNAGFFPVKVSFVTNHTYANIDVATVFANDEGKDSADYVSEHVLSVEQFDIEST